MATKRKGPAVNVEFQGLKELRAALDGLRKSEIAKVARNAVGAVAAELRDDIRRHLPSNVAHHAKDVVVRRPRARSSRANSDVIARAKRTNAAPGENGFSHWHFFEYGTQERKHKSGKRTGRMTATPFKNPAVARMNEKLEDRFTHHFLKKIEELWERM